MAPVLNWPPALHTAPRSSSGRVAGWDETVRPAREKSLFWHNMWKDCGKPRSGSVADIMRRTRAANDYAIRTVRKHEQEYVNQRFAENVLSNKTRDFWGEVKRLRQSGNVCSSCVDDFTNPGDIAEHLASQYRPLYSSVGYDVEELSKISKDINNLIVGWDHDCCVSVSEVYDAICKLKPGKSNGNIGLSSDYFILVGTALSVHISLLFSGLMMHGFVPESMQISTVIPIPKEKANRTDSNNYRGLH